jgi:hypothetical protein
MPLVAGMRSRDPNCLMGIWIGLVTAEFTLLGAFLVFARQRLFRRITTIWLIALALFVPWSLGMIYAHGHDFAWPRERIQHGLGLAAYGTLLQILAASAGSGFVWFVQEFEISQKQKPSFAERFLHFSIAELLWLTAIAAATFGLLRLAPMHRERNLDLTDQGLAMMLMFAVLNAMSPCILFALIHWFGLNERKSLRTRILLLVLTGQLIIIAADFRLPAHSELSAFLILASAPCSYTATLLAAWLLANWAGWELAWD